MRQLFRELVTLISLLGSVQVASQIRVDTTDNLSPVPKKNQAKIGLGLFAEITSNVNIANSNLVSKYDLDVFFLYNPSEKAKVKNIMGGDFLIPSNGFTQQTNGLFNFGIEVDLEISPKWQVIVNGG